jgi:hypothetical protein
VSNSNPRNETQPFSDFLLGLIGAATLRCDLDATELKSVSMALKNGWIDPEQACAWLSDAGLINEVIGGELPADSGVAA